MRHNDIKRKLPPLPRGYEWRLEKREYSPGGWYWPHKLRIMYKIWFLRIPSRDLYDITNGDSAEQLHADGVSLRRRLYERIGRQ